MISLRLKFLFIPFLLALTLVNGAIQNNIPNHFIDQGPPFQIANADPIQAQASHLERNLNLPPNHLSPARAYRPEAHFALVQRLLDNPNTRFMEVFAHENDVTYAVPQSYILNGQEKREVVFMRVGSNGWVSPTIIATVNPNVVPRRNQNLWSILTTGANLSKNDLVQRVGEIRF